MRSDAYVPAAFHRDEMARLKTRIKQLEIGHDDWRTKARRATSENERLREALRWFVNPLNYADKGSGMTIADKRPEIMRRGRVVARAALEGK